MKHSEHLVHANRLLLVANLLERNGPWAHLPPITNFDQDTFGQSQLLGRTTHCAVGHAWIDPIFQQHAPYELSTTWKGCRSLRRRRLMGIWAEVRGFKLSGFTAITAVLGRRANAQMLFHANPSARLFGHDAYSAEQKAEQIRAFVKSEYALVA